MTWEQAGIALFALAILCEQAHVASPIVLAWSHPGLRQIALSRPVETMLLPVIAIAAALAAPFMVIWWVYWTWNIYHFGAQHYGVCRIFGLRVPLWACIGGTAAIMVGGPWLIHDEWWRWFSLVAINFNHWLVDISLSSRVSRYWWLFLGFVLVLGCVGLAWKWPSSDHINTYAANKNALLTIMQARWGVGIVHFLYSRWVWKLSDPQVRATIGQDLFPTQLRLPHEGPFA
jgi:hypothetical protein